MFWTGLMIGGLVGFVLAAALSKLVGRFAAYMQAEREIVADTRQIAHEERVAAATKQADEKSLCRN